MTRYRIKIFSYLEKKECTPAGINLSYVTLTHAQKVAREAARKIGGGYEITAVNQETGKVEDVELGYGAWA